MGLKRYEQEIAAAAAHPDREHAVTVLESLARSLRRHEWPAERRAAAYDLATRAAEEARRLAQATSERENAREIANHERYPVHIGCGGEVHPFAGHETYCHRCDRGVPADDVVEPGE